MAVSAIVFAELSRDKTVSRPADQDYGSILSGRNR
jgi:hypothetical protein